MKMVKCSNENANWGFPSPIDDFLNDGFFDASSHRESWVPSLDVVEKDNTIEVSAELPGLDEKDVKIELHDGRLTISGEKKAEKEDKRKDTEENVYHAERRFGSFSRSIQVGSDIDEEKVEAEFKNGVLKVSLPKTEKAKPKLISVK